MYLLIAAAWLLMFIFSDGYFTSNDGETPWYGHLVVFILAPLWFCMSLGVLLYELGNKLYWWGE